MLVLTLRTDKPEAEVGIYKDGERLRYIKWQAHRELSVTIHKKINEVLKACDLALKDIDAVVVYQGPGSFTGLRIGISVANDLSYGLSIPIVGSTETKWIDQGIEKLKRGANEKNIIPEYGSEPHITEPKK
jgi:tRNA threonylcarbamoyladenosine biosynthesis protein TsaB